MNKIIVLFVVCILVLASCSNHKKTRLPDDFEQERQKFIMTINAFQESSKISSELPNLLPDEQASQEQKMITIINVSVLMSKEISNEFLNYLHPDLNDNFRNKLVKANELYLEGLANQYNDPSASMQKQITANQLLSEWAIFWESNVDNIDKNLSQKENRTFGQKVKNLLGADENRRSYWRMFFRFVISDIVAIYVFSFFLLALMLPIAPFTLIADKIKLIIFVPLLTLFLLFLGVGQAYFWVLWAAYCARTIEFFMDSPTVIHHWLYYLTGFIAVIAPIAWLASKESETSNSYKKTQNIKKGAAYYRLIAIVAFILFCIWTNFLDYKYISWLNNWLY